MEEQGMHGFKVYTVCTFYIIHFNVQCMDVLMMC